MAKLVWRSRDARNGSTTTATTTTNSMTQKKIMPHDEFLKRIRKSLYFGAPSTSSNSITECQSISRPFADYAAEIFSESHRGYSLNRLNCVTIGKLNAPPCSLILAMIYLDRLRDSDPQFAKRITPTELFLVSMMVSTKFYCGYDEDGFVSNFAEQGDISQDRLNQLEIEFLCALNWSIYVSNGDFFHKLKAIECELAKREGLKRGWLTYTELTYLLPSLSIAKSFLQYSTIFAVSYAASVVTIAGAFFLASQVPGTALYNCGNTRATTPTTSVAKSTTETAATTTSTMQSNVNPIDDVDSEVDTKCPLDNIDEQFNRLHEQINETTYASIQPNSNRTPTDLKNIVISIPADNYAQHIIGIRSGVNLRSFLDDEDDGNNRNAIINKTDYNNLIFEYMTATTRNKKLNDHNSCNSKLDSLLDWMKLI